GLMLLQDANDLLFAETAFPHRLSPRLENRLTSNRGLFRGARHTFRALHHPYDGRSMVRKGFGADLRRCSVTLECLGPPVVPQTEVKSKEKDSVVAKHPTLS
ncbi:hypothetical protein, partial [Rhodovulum sulfidophilum]|uniref:hypothetical protein n=1 Tax=Rhodovulum sulfidophilum TaxID=35806 RepID=UPI001F171ECB